MQLISVFLDKTVFNLEPNAIIRCFQSDDITIIGAHTGVPNARWCLAPLIFFVLKILLKDEYFWAGDNECTPVSIGNILYTSHA